MEQNWPGGSQRLEKDHKEITWKLPTGAALGHDQTGTRLVLATVVDLNSARTRCLLSQSRAKEVSPFLILTLSRWDLGKEPKIGS